MYLGRIIVGVVIKKDGKYLLIEEMRDGKLFLNIPAGHLDPYETPIEGAKREAKEESGFDVKLTSLRLVLSNTWNSGLHSAYWIFDGEPCGSSLQPEKGVVAGWFTLEEWEARMRVVEPMPSVPYIFAAVKNGSPLPKESLYFIDSREKPAKRQIL